MHTIKDDSNSAGGKLSSTGCAESTQDGVISRAVGKRIEGINIDEERVVETRSGQTQLPKTASVGFDLPPAYSMRKHQTSKTQNGFDEEVCGTTLKFIPDSADSSSPLAVVKPISIPSQLSSKEPPKAPQRSLSDQDFLPKKTRKSIASSVSSNSSRSSANSTTIFESSDATPITIILTAPDGEYPLRLPRPTQSQLEARCGPKRYNTFNKVRALRLANKTTTAPESRSDISTANLSKLPPKRLDRTHLVPPDSHELDQRRLRKAQEFQQVKAFMIQFLSAKGHALPEKLRLRIMNLYGICNDDMPPEVLAAWKTYAESGIVDEELDLSKAGTYRDQMRLLEKAFRSHISALTPQIHEIPICQPRSSSTDLSCPTAPNDNNRLVTIPGPKLPLPSPAVRKSPLIHSAHTPFYKQEAHDSSISITTISSSLSYETVDSNTTCSSGKMADEGVKRREGIFGTFRGWRKPKLRNEELRYEYGVARRRVVY